MNFQDNIQMDVWQRLPPSKYIVGRKRIARLVERAVREWPMPSLSNCETADEQQMIGKAYAYKIAQEEFGSIMIMLFTGLTSALVQVLLEWWLAKNTYRIEFALWKSEL